MLPPTTASSAGDDGKTIWTPPTCGFHGGIVREWRGPRSKGGLGARVAPLPRLAARFSSRIHVSRHAHPCAQHPRNKTEVGRRLALRLAQLEGVLPRGLLPDGPILASAVAQARR